MLHGLLMRRVERGWNFSQTAVLNFRVVKLEGASTVSREQLNHANVPFTIEINAASIHGSIAVNILGSGVREPVHVGVAMKHNSALVWAHVYTPGSNEFRTRDNTARLEQRTTFMELLFRLERFPIAPSKAGVSVLSDLTAHV
jgi:hypothetical protein